ncbi:MAG: NUDIX hydrolase [Thermodesulfobacteriota bacterium]|nr:NUDIX hydrolase [Thermodesulfobacteriota bacterium]
MPEKEYPDLPRVGVGAVVIQNDKVLLVKRGIPPSKGLWAIPGGNMKLGETLKETAEREIMEETGIAIEAGDPIYAFDFIERDDEGAILYHYVVVDLLAEYREGEPHGADDALEARWCTWEELLQLPVSKNTLALLRKIGFDRLSDSAS